MTSGKSLHSVNSQEENVSLLVEDPGGEVPPSVDGSSRPRPISSELAACWSLSKNFRELHTPASTRAGPLDGIRTIAVLWVVVVHTCSLTITVAPPPTPFEPPFYYRWILNGSYGVDMFFVLSGYLMYQILSKSIVAGTFRALRFYRDRALRLLPAYMVVMVIYWIVQTQVGDPTLAAGCSRTFWTNILFVNNFVPFQWQCMQWSWSIAVEYQFYLVSPLFVYYLCRRPFLGKVLAWSMVALSTVLNIILVCVLAFAMNDMGLYMDWVYVKSYTRMSPYFFGMLAAMAATEHADQRSKDRSWWKLGVALALFLVPAFAGSGAGADPIPVLFFFTVFGRQVLSIGLAYVMYFLVTNPDCLASRVLSCRAAYVMANLSYSIYLWHPFLVVALVAATGPPAVLYPTNYLGLFLLFLLVCAVTVLLATPLFLFVEKPFMNMRRTLDRLTLCSRTSGR